MNYQYLYFKYKLKYVNLKKNMQEISNNKSIIFDNISLYCGNNKFNDSFSSIDQLTNNMIGGKKLKKKNKIYKYNINNINMDLRPKYIEKVSEPWFTLISLGLKTVEGRKNKGKFKEMQIGDIIQWNNFDFGERNFLTKVIGKSEYKTFEEYLIAEGLNKCLPGIPTLEHGLSVYFTYFTKEQETEFGVVAIRLELI